MGQKLVGKLSNSFLAMHNCVWQHIRNAQACVRGKYHPSYEICQQLDYSHFSAIALDGSHISEIAAVFLHAHGGATLPFYILQNQNYVIPAGVIDNKDRLTFQFNYKPFQTIECDHENGIR